MTEATGKVRIKYPNVTISPQVRHKRNLRLKASRSTAKEVVTQRQNEARKFKSDFGDVEDLELKHTELDEAIRMYTNIFNSYNFDKFVHLLQYTCVTVEFS